MGVRSRRSSSATVQTIHTPAGIRSPSPSHSMKEVNEEEAGPSTAPSASADHSLHPDDRSKSPQRLNLKSSTSWVRWNAPVPSFPKPAVAGDKGKGKEALTEEAAPHPQLVDIGQDPIHSQRPAQLPAQIGMQSEAPAAPSFAPPRPRPPDPLEEVASVSPPTVVPVKSRGWFTRLPLEPTTKPKENPPIAAAENDSSNASSVPPVVDASASSAPGPSPSAFSPSDLPPVTLGSPPDDATPSRIPASLAQRSENGGKGWQVFLWGSEGRGTATERKGSSTTTPPTEPPHKNKTEVGESIPVPTERSSGVPACSVTDTSPPEAATAVEPPTVPVETTSKPGWHNYLYSFVAPPRSVADLAGMPSQPTSHIVEPTSPTTDQKPIPIEGPTLSVDPASSGPTTNTEPLSNRRPSTSGSAGWLNYLALPYAQKKLASSDASSTKTGESVVGGRKFVDGVGEEVMDLSGDPNFPNSPPSSVTKLEDNPQPVSTKGAKPRQYSSSNRSVGSKTPQPSSPKAQSSLDGKIPSAPASSKMQCSSSLPLPPPSLAVQPNLAIPSFAMTFDRPPRSFLPQQASSTSATQTGKGATAATTGLAWKAFGAVGGYVYGGAPEPPKPTSDSLTEDEKETRGRKEGRGVGADLPRRIGLGSGSPDDGWKGVKRVVVVGVHGWFPAKMLNS